jgi:hypothetical protein
MPAEAIAEAGNELQTRRAAPYRDNAVRRLRRPACVAGRRALAWRLAGPFITRPTHCDVVHPRYAA